MLGRIVRFVALLALMLSGLSLTGASAAPIANDAFSRTWERTDQPVAAGSVSRTWMWGPEAFSGAMPEAYAESPDGQRTVQYSAGYIYAHLEMIFILVARTRGPTS